MPPVYTTHLLGAEENEEDEIPATGMDIELSEMVMCKVHGNHQKGVMSEERGLNKNRIKKLVSFYLFLLIFWTHLAAWDVSSQTRNPTQDLLYWKYRVS